MTEPENVHVFARWGGRAAAAGGAAWVLYGLMLGAVGDHVVPLFTAAPVGFSLGCLGLQQRLARPRQPWEQYAASVFSWATLPTAGLAFGFAMALPRQDLPGPLTGLTFCALLVIAAALIMLGRVSRRHPRPGPAPVFCRWLALVMFALLILAGLGTDFHERAPALPILVAGLLWLRFGLQVARPHVPEPPADEAASVAVA